MIKVAESDRLRSPSVGFHTHNPAPSIWIYWLDQCIIEAARTVFITVDGGWIGEVNVKWLIRFSKHANALQLRVDQSHRFKSNIWSNIRPKHWLMSVRFALSSHVLSRQTTGHNCLNIHSSFPFNYQFKKMIINPKLALVGPRAARGLSMLLKYDLYSWSVIRSTRDQRAIGYRFISRIDLVKI